MGTISRKIFEKSSDLESLPPEGTGFRDALCLIGTSLSLPMLNRGKSGVLG